MAMESISAIRFTWLAQECAKDLFIAIAKEVYEAGGNLITQYLPDNIRQSSLPVFFCRMALMNRFHFFPHHTGRV
jgi:aminopeptidase